MNALRQAQDDIGFADEARHAMHGAQRFAKRNGRLRVYAIAPDGAKDY